MTGVILLKTPKTTVSSNSLRDPAVTNYPEAEARVNPSFCNYYNSGKTCTFTPNCRFSHKCKSVAVSIQLRSAGQHNNYSYVYTLGEKPHIHCMSPRLPTTFTITKKNSY